MDIYPKDDSITLFITTIALFLVCSIGSTIGYMYQQHTIKSLQEQISLLQNGITTLNIPNAQTGETEAYMATQVASIKGITTHEIMPVFLRVDHYPEYLEYKRKKIVNEFLVHNEKDTK